MKIPNSNAGSGLEFLREPYSQEKYMHFIQHEFLTDNFTPKHEEIVLPNEPEYIKPIIISLGEDKTLGVKVFEFCQIKENARVGVSKDIFKFMARYPCDRILAIVRSSVISQPYRLSLATIDHAIEADDIKTAYSNPRRYSYLLGPDAKVLTPYKYLIEKGRIKDFDDLKSRFEVEVVNKEFYESVAAKFTELVGGKRKIKAKETEFKALLKLPSTTDHPKMQEFGVRLIGRLIFCWFLQKKKSANGVPLIDESLLSTEAVKNNKDYYHSVLENLFFQTLNTPFKDRLPEFKKDFYKNIPFLNGGLFEPHREDDYYEIRSGKPVPQYPLKVPNEWFLGLFEIFETYNFTIDENTSVDVDLSVDPEMLGRVFENLLAEINPETGETARKATGSYYTPRPIVEYMVDESLKQYILTKTGIAEDKLTGLFSYASDETDLTDEEKGKIIAALDEAKILDPACGSGAFPISILQKIVLILQKVDPENKGWIKSMLKNVDEAFMQRIVAKYQDENLDYLRKLGIIQKSIYGVDIQTIAVEISKLRCFLTLIVDEKINDSEENRGILSLPNLEFKFVAANTLIGLPKKNEIGGLTDLFNIDDEVEEFKKIRDRYFRCSVTDKKKIQSEFEKKQKQIVQEHYNKVAHDEAALKLASWEPFKNESSDWFDANWMLGVKNGFDIVIGNPPWGQKSVKFDKTNRIYLKNNYNYASEGIFDISRFFIEKSLLLTKEKSIFCNILPDIILLKNYNSTRKQLLFDTKIISIVHWGMVFQNVNLDSFSILCKKEIISGNNIIATIHEKNHTTTKIISQNLFKELEGFKFNLHLEPNSLDLLNNLKKFPKLGEIFRIHEGIHSGNIREKLFINEPKNKDSKRLILGGKELNRFLINWGGGWVDYSKSIINKEVGEYAGLGKKEYFENNKIVIRRTGDYILAAYDFKQYYFSNNVFVCIPINENYEAIKFYTGVLNSKFMTWYFNALQPRKGKLFAELKINQLASFPVPHFDKNNFHHEKIINLVEKLSTQEKKIDREEIGKLMYDLDELVYQIFELTQSERLIIEQFYK